VTRRLRALFLTTLQVQRLTYYEFIFVSLVFIYYSSKSLKNVGTKLFILRKEDTFFTVEVLHNSDFYIYEV
jgi:hypothetical protein